MKRNTNGQTSRRQLIQTGIASVAGAATVGLATRGTANAQTPAEPTTERTNPNRRFAGKVVLVTGSTSNLTAVWRCMKHEIAQMLKQGGGAIVNTGSTLSLRAVPGVPAYCASKHGLMGLTAAAATSMPPKTFVSILSSPVPSTRP